MATFWAFLSQFRACDERSSRQVKLDGEAAIAGRAHNCCFGAAICRVRCGVIYSASGTGNAARTGSLQLRSHSIPGLAGDWRTYPLLWKPICPVASGLKQTRYRGAVMETSALI